MLAERWTPLVVRELLAGNHRFTDIQRGVPRMSPALLSRRLDTLEAAGVVERRPKPGGNGHTYHLTEAGRQLCAWIELMGTWGERWVRRDVDLEDADPAWLMWDLRNQVDHDAFPDRQVVIHFRLRSAPEGQRAWWLVVDEPEVDLCRTDPGHPVDLTVRTDPVTVARLRVGDTTLSAALRSGRLTLDGSVAVTRRFRDWFTPGPFADVDRRGVRPAPTD